jgi:predicted nucleotidyltransferase
MTVAARTYLDPRTEAFMADVLAAIDAHASLLGAFVIGSGAAGGFDPGTSDVDLVAVVDGPPRDRQALAAEVAALRSPVRDLELVVYVQGRRPGDFELNLNHGVDRPDAEPFWFVIDAALAQEQAVPVWGERPWSEFFEPVRPDEIRGAMQASLDWAGRQGAEDEFARLQAARVRHYLEHGEWITKKEAQA